MSSSIRASSSARKRGVRIGRPLRSLAIAAAALLALLVMSVLVAGYGTLPSLAGRPGSGAPVDTGETRLAKAILPMVSAHPGLSGIYPILDARDAFAARALLAQAAERTLDVRYYIWRNDTSGAALVEALRAAADRGVRVRLLLDDNNTLGLDPILAALDSYPNIEIRLFNPLAIRTPRWLGYVIDFARLNRRMHNKSFTADNQAAIVGGRNVGDEYFGATNGVLFADLDVLAIGPIVSDIATDFDRYWASGSSYPVRGLLPATDPAALAEARTRFERDAAARAYVDAINNSPFVRAWKQGTLHPVWASTELLSDDPAKALGSVAPDALLFETLRKIIEKSTFEVDVVSPYFVPTQVGVDALVALARRGVKVRILTNALEATDVALVHAGYAKWRKPLLENGIALYELRRTSHDDASRPDAHLFGSSGSSLHAKTFSVDDARVFVGSFNFDPRSAKLNTEMGLVIDSPELAQRMNSVLATRIPSDAYEVRLSAAGLQWVEHRDDEWVLHDTEPNASYWQRAQIRLLSMLPVEWLL